MATITNLKLELLEHNHQTRTAKVKVSYKVYLSSVERNMTGLRYRENIELWGEDTPDPDDFLYRFPTAVFPAEQDGVVSRSRTVTVGDDVLDEDGFPRPTDEVYAKVCIKPLLPTGNCRKSNVIKHKF